MPQISNSPGFVKLGLRPALVAVAVALLAYLLGVDFGPLDGFMSRWAALLLELGGAIACALRAIHVREERSAWALIAVGVFCWAVGDAVFRIEYFAQGSPPTFTAANALFLAFYPFAYGGIALLIRDRARFASIEVWLDGLIAALAIGALTSAVVLNAVLEQIGGSSPGTAVNLAYVLGDAILLGLVLVAFALTGWHLDHAWAWLGGALAAFAVSDSVYLYQVARGTYSGGGSLDAGWAVALLLVGVAAWHMDKPVSRGETWRSIALPVTFGFGALAIEAYDHFTHVTTLALVLATACLAAVLARLAMTFGQYLRMLRASQEQATTDALTGLGNRRQLMLDLREALRIQPGEESQLLLLLDLDRFKSYNDTLGHPAGDALLELLARRLERDLRPWGRAYRLGGDEFCALVHLDGHTPAQLGDIATRALREPDALVPISSSAGWVLIPAEATDASSALRIADRRMYAKKGEHGHAERRQGPRAAYGARRPALI